jgi:hypothetical protein
MRHGRRFFCVASLFYFYRSEGRASDVKANNSTEYSVFFHSFLLFIILLRCHLGLLYNPEIIESIHSGP